MRRSWLILSLGFGIVIALIALLGFGARRRARTINDEMIAAHQKYLVTEAVLNEIPAALYLADILVRDYLLDPSQSAAPAYRQQILGIRSSLRTRLDALADASTEDNRAVQELRKEVRAYWDSVQPVFDWNPQEKAARSYSFLRRQVLPRRDAVVALEREVSHLNVLNLQREQRRLREQQGTLQSFLNKMLLFALSVGILVAVASTLRVFVLEKQGDQQRSRIVLDEENLRHLSRKLLQAQEEERKCLSRDLHDAVGQMLTGMGMALSNFESLQPGLTEKSREQLDDAKHLNADTIRLVRDLAMGLRPSMLDDIGLGPALQWQAREFSRRSGISAVVQLDGALGGLPDDHRTCIYRVVQEALTNCVRHAGAKGIRVSVHGGSDLVNVTIQDDGIGFDPEHPVAEGLGLVGIRERVRQLGGTVAITSQAQKGTIVTVELPLPRGATA
jgi:signal transduction histidine kinase